MTATPSILAGVLAECDARGIRLSPAGDGGLSIDASRDALTPDLLERLKARKADILASLRPGTGTCQADTTDPTHPPGDVRLGGK